MTAVAEKKQPKAKAEWSPPKTFVGQRVLWHHGQSWKDAGTENKPSAAIVTEVCNGGRVRLAILPVDSAAFTAPDDPVPHKDDPMAERLIQGDPDGGVWEECPADNAANVISLQELVYLQGEEIETQGRRIDELNQTITKALQGIRPAA